jgi:uncharacterized protein
MNMKIMMILSPAKTLDLSSLAPGAGASWTIPECSPATTAAVAMALRQLSPAQLKIKMKISDQLAATTHSYWRDFDDSHHQTAMATTTNNNNAAAAFPRKPCLLVYSGAAYQGLDAPSLSSAAGDYLQDRLRILSAAYGCLRPYDVIHPYRLEMGTKGIPITVVPAITTTEHVVDGEVVDDADVDDDGLSTKKKKKKPTKAMSLADVWRESVTNYLAKELTTTITTTDDGGDSSSGAVLLNLASDEYAAAVDSKRFSNNVRYIKIIFQEQQSGRVVAVHAKRARGLMVRYLADQQADDLATVKAFAVEGYVFDTKKSNDETYVFHRRKQQSPPPPSTATKRPVGTTTTTTVATRGGGGHNHNNNKKKKTTTT